MAQFCIRPIQIDIISRSTEISLWGQPHFQDRLMISRFDSNSSPPKTLSPRTALLTLRIIWLGMIMALVVFLCVVAFVLLPGRAQPANPRPLLVTVNLVMLLTIVPITLVIRGLIFRAGRSPAGIRFPAYMTGNIVFWAGCDSVAFSGLVFSIVNGSMWPFIVFVAIAMGLMAITFPTGTALDRSDDSTNS
jgi:hypothetical protein